MFLGAMVIEMQAFARFENSGGTFLGVDSQAAARTPSRGSKRPGATALRRRRSMAASRGSVPGLEIAMRATPTVEPQLNSATVSRSKAGTGRK